MSILQDLMALRATQAEPIVEAEDNLDPKEVASMARDLQEYHDTIVEKMDEVRHLVKQLPRSFRGSAEAYWIPHIMIALGGEHEWMTAGHESTMQKMIDEMNEYSDGGPGDDDEGDHEFR